MRPLVGGRDPIPAALSFSGSRNPRLNDAYQIVMRRIGDMDRHDLTT
jgi:hypothetical protein